MGNRLKIGIIGAGGISCSHIEAYRKHPDVELYAFCDINADRLRYMGERYGVTRLYTDMNALLALPELDAVSVCTWNNGHAPCTIAALNAGKHVLCEKPMAATEADARKMLEARDKSGKLLTVGYQYRHFPVNQVAKRTIDDGWLGDIYYAESTYLRRRGVPTWGVFTDKSKQGGGPLIDIGTHALDLTLFFMNNYEPLYVVGTAFEKLGRLLDAEHQGQTRRDMTPDTWNHETYDVEDLAVGQIKMKNGAVIDLKASWALNMAEDAGAFGDAKVKLCGTKGGLDTHTGVVRLNHVVAGQPAMTTIGRKVDAYIPGFTGGKPPVSLEHQIFVEALLGKRDLFVTADQAYVVTKILDAIYESSRTNKPVYFD